MKHWTDEETIMSTEENKAIVGRWFTEFWARSSTRRSSTSWPPRTSGSSIRCTSRCAAGTRSARSRRSSALRSLT